MDKRKAKILNKMMWRHRARAFVAVAFIPALMLLIYLVYLAEEQGAQRSQMEGTVEQVFQTSGKVEGNPYLISVLLPDGSKITARSPRDAGIPAIGQIIQLQKVQHPSDRVSYRRLR